MTYHDKEIQDNLGEIDFSPTQSSHTNPELKGGNDE